MNATHQSIEPDARPPIPQRRIGYVRAKVDDPAAMEQIAVLAAVGIGRDRGTLYCDPALGERGGRGWSSCRGVLRAGDTLVVSTIDVLGRDLSGLLETLAELVFDSGIRIEAVVDGIDTATPAGAAILAGVTWTRRWEARLRRDRRAAGLIAAKVSGRIGRRPHKLGDDQIREARGRIDRGESGAAVARDLGMSRSGLYKNFERLGLGATSRGDGV